GRARWFMTGARQKLAHAAWSAGLRSLAVAGPAYARTFGETVRLVVGEPTDLIVAHTQPMLAVAALAARRLRCAWAFDCEDILSEEFGEGIDDAGHQALVRRIVNALAELLAEN